MTPAPWTAAQDDALRALVAERRWTDDEMGAMLGRSGRRIMEHRKRLGLAASKWGAQEDKTLRALLAGRLSDAEIARTMGRGISNIRFHRRRLGLKACGKGGGRGWKHSAETRAKISAGNRKRWQDPDYREATLPHVLQALANGRARYESTRWRRPKADTPEGQLFSKIERVLGADAARRELGYDRAPTSTTGGQHA